MLATTLKCLLSSCGVRVHTVRTSLSETLRINRRFNFLHCQRFASIEGFNLKEISMEEARRKAVLLSCDPGHDDALAIILAGYSPSIRLLGIDTVAANTSVQRVTQNALQILDVAGLQRIGVVQGQGKPLVRSVRLSLKFLYNKIPLSHVVKLLDSDKFCSSGTAQIHGDSGLELRQGSLPPTNLSPLPQKAVLHMYQQLAREKETSGQNAVLVCTGALTNAAVLLILYPEAADLIEEIVLMGGAIGSGNTGPAAEFNIQVDPEAAKVVFESGVPITMVPLEVTHTALATPEVLRSICSKESPFLLLVKEILLYFADTYKSVFGFECPPVHDPCAMAYVIAPHIFKTEKMRVDVETVSPLSAGQTVCDIYHMSDLPKNVNVAKEMDVEAFWSLLIDAIHAADVASPLNTTNC